MYRAGNLLVLLLPSVRSFAFVPTSNRVTAPPTQLSSRPRPKDSYTIPEEYHVLVLPGFGNGYEDYASKNSLLPSLLDRGWAADQVSILPVKRSDWLRVFARGLFDETFWSSNMSPTRPAFSWYLDLVAKEVRRIEEDAKMKNSGGQGGEGEAKIILVGHSAGGWLARAAICFGSKSHNKRNEILTQSTINPKSIAGVVTLGSPNKSPPVGSFDLTRGALRITNEHYSDNRNLSSSAFVVSVSGSAVKGTINSKKNNSTQLNRSPLSDLAFKSYKFICGDGNTAGDGIVPCCAAHIANAIQVDLKNVFHSAHLHDRWYGADSVIDQWHDFVLKEMEKLPRNGPFRMFQQNTFAR